MGKADTRLLLLLTPPGRRKIKAAEQVTNTAELSTGKLN